MNNDNEVKHSFSIQAEKFATYHMSKAEYTDYLIQCIKANGNEHALEVAAGTCICGRAVAPQVKDIICLDLTEAMLEQGKKLLHLQLSYPDIVPLPFAVTDYLNRIKTKRT